MTNYLALTEQIPLPLLGNWSNYGSGYGYASVNKSNDLVTITGLIRGSDWGELARLPVGYRPLKSLIFNVNNHGISARVDVYPDGLVEWRAGGNQHGWISLSGITFSTLDGTDLTLVNGWQNYGVSGHDWGHAKFTKTADGIVTLSGLIRGGEWGHLVQLPPGYRPLKSIIFDANNNEDGARVDVYPDGLVEWKAGGNQHGWISLSGISFTTLEGTDLPLTNKWQNYGVGGHDWEHATFTKATDGLVNISGLINGGLWGNLATLPHGYRPDKRIIYSVNNHSNVSRVDVLPDGTITWVAGGNSNGWISLTGIKFYAKYKSVNFTADAALAAAAAEASAIESAAQASIAAANAITSLSNLESSISQSTALESTITALYAEKQHAVVSLLMDFSGSLYVGSGFIINNGLDYYICTVGHNVLGVNRDTRATKIIASISRSSGDNTAVECTVMGVAGYADIALLKMNTTLTGLTHLEFAEDNAQIKNGDISIVIGDPLGVDAQSFSMGRNRDVKFIYGNTVRSHCTTASVFGGNSGSPILDVNFKVIGIISYGMSDSETFSWGAHYSVLKIVTNYIIDNYNTFTMPIANYKGGSFNAGLELVDSSYAYSNGNSVQSLEGYYVTTPSGALVSGDIIKKINGDSLGVYDNQVTPVAIYLNKNQQLSVHLNNDAAATLITPTELSVADDIYLGGGGSSEYPVSNIKLWGPVKKN